MLYNKPKDLKYVDMCKEFDEEFYSGKDVRNDSKLFKYMYLVYYMFASKAHLFSNMDDYDKYAQYAASTIYRRYLKKEREGEKIKSLKNYAETTFRHLKTSFQKEEFNRVVGAGYDDEEAEAMGKYMLSAIQPSYAEDLYEDMQNLLAIFPKTVYKVIKQSPYRHDKLMCKRLYISCLLTFISSITLCAENAKKLERKADKEGIDESKIDTYYCRLLNKEKDKPAVLWKLDDKYADYVKVLTNKARYLLNNKISDTKNKYVLPDDAVEAVMSNLYKEVYGSGSEEEY